MAKDQIRQEVMKPSTHWVEAGSGTIGRVYIEIIGCDGLPNMDWGNISRRVSTDAFACLVFEDSIVNTDIISNTRNPRWAPWCRRAFAFNVSHPSSNILLGLFDWDPEKSPVQVAMSFASDVHDPIARIMINVANAVSNCTYTTTVSKAMSLCETHRASLVGLYSHFGSYEFSDSTLCILPSRRNTDKRLVVRLHFGFGKSFTMKERRCWSE